MKESSDKQTGSLQVGETVSGGSGGVSRGACGSWPVLGSRIDGEEGVGSAKLHELSGYPSGATDANRTGQDSTGLDIRAVELSTVGKDSQ